MSARVAPVLALAIAGCSFTKEPYLFTSLGEARDGSVAADDATASDAGRPEDAGVFADDAMTQPDAGPGPSGTAALFTAIDQGMVAAAPGYVPSDGSPRTIEAWLRGARGPRSGRIMGFVSPGRKLELLYALTNDLGTLILIHPEGVLTSARRPEFADGQWHHVAVTMTSTSPTSVVTITFFVDGAPISEGTKGPTDLEGARQMIIGGNAADPIGFDHAEIDEVRLWSIARTAGEIQADMRRIVREAPGLVGYWAMTQIGQGPGLPIDNEAMPVPTSSKAPSLFTTGVVQFSTSGPF